MTVSIQLWAEVIKCPNEQSSTELQSITVLKIDETNNWVLHTKRSSSHIFLLILETFSNRITGINKMSLSLHFYIWTMLRKEQIHSPLMEKWNYLFCKDRNIQIDFCPLCCYTIAFFYHTQYNYLSLCGFKPLTQALTMSNITLWYSEEWYDWSLSQVQRVDLDNGVLYCYSICQCYENCCNSIVRFFLFYKKSQLLLGFAPIMTYNNIYFWIWGKRPNGCTQI